MKEKKKSLKKAGASVGTILGVAFITSMLLFTGQTPKLENDEGTWQVVWSGNLVEAAEADPGSGASGFLEIFYVNHSEDPVAAYEENTSATIEGWCTAGYGYATTDEFDLQLSSAVTFDIVVRARFNKTHAWETDKFIGSDVRVNITHTGLDGNPISDENGTRVETHNDSSDEYLWCNFYFNNNGDGYSIAAGGARADNKCSEISIEAKF